MAFHKRKWLIVSFAVALTLLMLVSVGIFLGRSEEPKVLTSGRFIEFENKKFEIDWAVSDSQRVKGLSGTVSLERNRGLMFSFPTENFHSIWMKDMNYSLDIIWLDSELKVVHLEESVSPESYPEIFRPNKPSRYVLEINEGLAKKYSIELGEQAKVTS